MATCQFAPAMHNAEATYSALFTRPCCTRWISSSLICDDHAVQLGAKPDAARKTACKWCGEINSVRASFIEPITITKQG